MLSGIYLFPSFSNGIPVMVLGFGEFHPASHAQDDILRLMAVCFWNLFSGLVVLDQADVLLRDEDAKEPHAAPQLVLF